MLIQHGMIASIRDGGLFSRLGAMGARLISVARPGYGQSSARSLASVAEWGEVAARLASALSLQRFDVLGISSGAPYAYAIGYKLPDRVRNIFVLSGTPALFDPEIAKRWPYPVDPIADMPKLQLLARELFFSSVTESDLSRDDVRDSMMNDCYGIALDLKLRCNDWGFSLSEIKAPVHMQHSKEDGQVPFVTAEMTAKLLSHCQLHVRNHGEHFSAEVLDDFIDTVMADVLGGQPNMSLQLSP